MTKTEPKSPTKNPSGEMVGDYLKRVASGKSVWQQHPSMSRWSCPEQQRQGGRSSGL